MSVRTLTLGPVLRAMLALSGLSAVSVADAGCKSRGERTDAPFTTDTARARASELERHLKKDPKDDAAALELAHLYWLHLRAPAKATPILERLAAAGNPAAQVSRMLMADTRLDLRTTRTMAQALVRGAGTAGGTPEHAAMQVALAELAARYLTENHGELPDDDVEFSRFHADVERLELPVSVSHALQSLRASIARRLDQPYKGYYDAQGCVRAPPTNSRLPSDLASPARRGDTFNVQEYVDRRSPRRRDACGGRRRNAR